METRTAINEMAGAVQVVDDFVKQCGWGAGSKTMSAICWSFGWPVDFRPKSGMGTSKFD